jgi:hypothetical protein
VNISRKEGKGMERQGGKISRQMYERRRIGAINECKRTGIRVRKLACCWNMDTGYSSVGCQLRT